MSGGVGPTAGGDDIRLPKEEEETEYHHHGAAAATAHSPRGRFFSFRQLNALAVVIVLSASGMVAAADIAFVLFSFVYLHLLSSTAFPPSSPVPDPPVFGFRNRLLASYVAAAALVGLVLPIAYILDGVLAGDKEGIKAAAPHVFLLAAQVFFEHVTFSGRFSLPMRAFVPIFYNTKRLFTLADWVRHEIGKVDGDHGSPRRLFAGRALAFANLGLWAFNLFGFLLPVYLPRALKRYYCGGYNNSNNNKAKSIKTK